jgi:DNA polymerase
MSSAPLLDQARRVLAQHAQTSKLLGVDFVPSVRSSDLDAGAFSTARAEHVEIAPPAPSIAPAARPTAGIPAAPAARVKPLELRQETSDLPPVLFEPKPLPTTTPPSPAAVSTPRDPARTAADVERDLAQIRADYERDAPHRAFVTSFTNIVFGEGDPLARIMFVGEAPGEEEDKTGRPFVGRAGGLLDKMIAGMGLKRSDVYIANILKTRPPNNATPTVDECIICMPYIARQIAAIRPEAIVTLGLTSTKALLRTDLTMSRLRGVWASYQTVDGVLIPVMPTFHPAYVLRAYNDENRTKVWNDLKLVLQRLNLPVPARP